MGKTISWAPWSPWTRSWPTNNDGIGPLFDRLGNGDVGWSFPGSDGESRTTQASADFMLGLYGDMAGG